MGKRAEKEAWKSLPFINLFEGHKDQKIWNIARKAYAFVDLALTLDFLTTLAFVSVKVENGGKRKQMELADSLIKGATNAFLNLSPELFRDFLVAYADRHEKVMKTSGTRVTFDLVNLLARTGGNCLLAKKLFLQIFSVAKICGDFPFPKDHLGKRTMAAFFGFLLGVIASAKRVSTWNVLLEAMTYDEEIEEMLASIFYCFSLYGIKTFEVVSLDTWRPKEKVVKLGLPGKGAQELGFYAGSDKLLLPAPDNLCWRLRAVIHRATGKAQQVVVDHQRLAAWCIKERPTLERVFADRWAEILSDCDKTGIRKGGLDYGTFNDGLLSDLGIREIRFWREGTEFPEVTAEFTFQYFSLAIKERIHLKPKPLVDYRGYSCEESDAIDMALAFIAMDCYHRIIIGLAQGAHRSHKKGVGVRSRNVTARDMRPIFVRLPNGHRASPEAVQLSIGTFGHPPPAGKTYRDEHRWPREDTTVMLADPRPVLVVSDKDFNLG